MLLRCMPAVERRMAYLLTALSKRVEHFARHRDDLRGGGIRLLVAQHVGRLLVEVDARHRVARGDIAVVDHGLGIAIDLRGARGERDVGGEFLDGREDGFRAAVEHVGAQRVGQCESVAVVAGGAGVVAHGEACRPPRARH